MLQVAFFILHQVAESSDITLLFWAKKHAYFTKCCDLRHFLPLPSMGNRVLDNFHFRENKIILYRNINVS